jgi:copper homeostasis protein (lipoprotein)
VPATFTGTLPCADCPGIALTLTLLADGTFRLREVYQERPAVFRDRGRWALADNGARLLLRGGTEGPRQFAVLGPDSLEMLDTQGRAVPSQAGSTLARAAELDWVRDTMRLLGTYTYMADAGRFTDCLTGKSYPVAQVGANAALEGAYGEAVGEPSGPLLILVTGHFEERESMEPGRREEHVVVDQVRRVGPETSCKRPMPNATLENTYWKVMAIGAQPARVADNIPEPHLLLHPAQNRASGSTGCNRFTGNYQLNGDSLRFGRLAATLRACLDPDQSRQESALVQALEETRAWRVTGDTLVLSGEIGPLARFAAQYLR